MELHEYLIGKTSLNNYVNQLKHNDALFQVHYWGVLPKHYDNPLHKHSFFEVCYVVEGEGTYIDGDSSYVLQKNTVFLSRPQVMHQIKSKKGLALLYVAFELNESASAEEWVKIMNKLRQCNEVVIHNKNEIETILLWKTLLIQATKWENAFFDPMISSIAVCLILSILQDFVPELKRNNNAMGPKKYSIILTQAQLYIDDNLSNSLKLTDVAKHFHISGRHLSRIFVSELGISFSKYIQEQRIKKAVILLKTTNLPLKEIAKETGFGNVQYFSRVFTSMMRHSPADFRCMFVDTNTIIYSD